MVGKAKGEADAVKPDAVLGVEEETEKQRKDREAEEKRQRLKEYGGPVSVRKLLSLASTWELFIFFAGVLGAMAHGSAQPLMCMMFGDLIDALAESLGSNFDFLSEVSTVAMKFMLIGVGVCFVGTLQGFAFPYFAESQVIKMRPLYFELALYRDVGWFDTHDAAALPTEMGQELDTYSESFGNKLGTSVMSLTGAILGYVFGLYLSWQVGLMMTLALPVMGLGGGIMAQSVMDMMQEVQGAYTNAATLVNEVLFAVRTVVSFGGEHRELARYSEQVEVARKGGIKNRAKMGFGMGYIWLAYFSAMALAFYFGMRLVYGGLELSVGRMMASFFCVLTAGFTIGQIFPGFAAVHETRSIMARFFYLNDHESEIQKRGQDARRTVGPIESLQLESVHFAYPARPAIPVLNGLSLNVQKGQKVAVVGESGSGKSTVMALLERFYDPQQGRVLVNGQDLREFSVKSFRSQVGYVGQEPVLFATSVRANIMQGCPDATEADIQRVAKHAQLDFINELPEMFETFVGSGGSQFSGGQKQRIAIARALLKQPSVLFLDEATSALDSASEKMIQGTIDKIGSDSELGITIVSIAHRLSTVRNSDVIYVLSGGCVVEQGSHDELTAQSGGVYKALAAAQEMASSQEDSNDQGEGAGQVEQAEQEGAGGKRTLQPALQVANTPAGEEEREKRIAKTYKVPLARLATLCKPEWIYMVPGMLAAFGSGCCFPVLAVFFLVDAMVAFLGKDNKELMRDEVENAALWIVLVGAFKWLCTFIQFTCFAIMGEAMTKRARVEMLTAIFKQEVGFHDNPENTPGKLTKALQVHAYRIARFCISLGDVADALCSILVGLCLAFVNSWQMTMAMLLTVPVFGMAQSIQILVMMGSATKENATLKSAQQVLTDAIINSRTVQAANCEQDCLSLYVSVIKTTTNHLCRRHFLGGFAFGLSNGVMFWMISAGFWFMGYLIEEGLTDFEKGQRAFMGVLYAAMGAGMAFAFTGDATKAKVSAHDLFELIDRKPLIDGLNPTGDVPQGTNQVGRLEFANVCFFYPFRPDVQVLNGINFTIEAGQSVGICGPSGGGKSTVMSLIQRFYDPQGGNVLIGTDRLSLNSVNIRWWRKQIGFVGQEPVLFDTTVLENVKYGFTEGEEVSAERLEECKQMANLSFLDEGKSQGWETKVGPRGARLSGGQKQRVAICRALVRNPPILLLDEATSALDSQSEQKVSAALEAARQGRTSFAIAHRLSTIQDCDVILVVAEGRIVERGTHLELLEAKGVYSKLQGQSLAAK